VFEKSRGPGGRMASKRVGEGSADIGAQYFTARNPEFLAFLERWAGSDAFQEWPATFRFQDETLGWQPFPEEKRYVGVPRMTAITRALSAHADVTAQVRIERLQRAGTQWQLVCTEGQSHGVFDRVIITAPPAQARDLLLASELGGMADELANPVEQILPCWAVAAHYTQPPVEDADALRPHSDVLYWVANNSSKPGRDDAGQWWVLHATPEWTSAHVDAEPEKVSMALADELSALTGADIKPDQTVAHRWLYARSAGGAQPGFLYDAENGIGLAGDWLAGGRVEGAWESAARLVAAMQ